MQIELEVKVTAKIKQQVGKATECRPSLDPAPTWQEIFTYWQSKEVPQVEVVSYDPEVHDVGIPWFEKSLRFSTQRNFFVVQENPTKGTAWALAHTVAKGGPSLFAAFALMTTLRHLDERSNLSFAVREHLDQISPSIDGHWHSNAKYVLPCEVNRGSSLIKSQDWHLRVDLAAQAWTELAANFQVVRQPLWT